MIFVLTEMHVNKMLSVLKDWSPGVCSRGFLLQLLAAAAAAVAAVLLASLHP